MGKTASKTQGSSEQLLNASHTFMLTIHPKKALSVHNPLDRPIKYKRLFDSDEENPMMTKNLQVNHLRAEGITDCSRCVNYLGTRISDMAYVAMSEVMYYRTQLDQQHQSHVTALENEVPEVLSPRMLNVAFIILNDFLKLEGLRPTCSFLLENILDCEYQVLAMGTTKKNDNWITRLKQDKLTIQALQQLCEIFESDDGRCLVLRAKETSLAIPTGATRNLIGSAATTSNSDDIEVQDEPKAYDIPPPARINRSYLNKITPPPPAFCDDQAELEQTSFV